MLNQPKSQKPRFNHCLITLSGILFLSLLFSACSTIRLQLNQFTQEETSLPSGMKTATEDPLVRSEDSFVITVKDDSETFLIGKEEISKDRLSERIASFFKDKIPNEKIVFVKAASTLKYKTISDLFKSIIKAGVDEVGLVVIKENNEKPGAGPTVFHINFPEDNFPSQTMPRPNPLVLVVGIDKDKNLSLNNESMGNVENTNKLTDRLKGVFRERENNGVFRAGTNEIEKTTIIKASRSLEYVDVAKLIDAVRLSTAQPVVIQVDNLPD